MKIPSPHISPPPVLFCLYLGAWTLVYSLYYFTTAALPRTLIRTSIEKKKTKHFVMCRPRCQIAAGVVFAASVLDAVPITRNWLFSIVYGISTPPRELMRDMFQAPICFRQDLGISGEVLKHARLNSEESVLRCVAIASAFIKTSSQAA